MQVLDAWRKGGSEDMESMLKAVAGAMAPPLPDMLQGVKLKRGQKAALQQFRDLFVCVRSEAARYGPDRCA